MDKMEALLSEARAKFYHKHAQYGIDRTKWNCTLCGTWGEQGGRHEQTCLIRRIDLVIGPDEKFPGKAAP